MLKVYLCAMFMQLFWHGFSCVRIEASNGEQEAILVTDPFESEASVRFPRTLEPDLVVLSHQDRGRFPLSVFENKPFVVSDPGEYEVKGLFAHIFALTQEKGLTHTLITRFEIEGMSIGFLGGLSRVLQEEEAGKLEDLDVLMLPVGGGGCLTAVQAVEMVNMIEPRLVIPLHFDLPGLKEPLGSVDVFCKLLSGAERQNVNKLKLAKKDLPSDKLVIAVLERS